MVQILQYNIVFQALAWTLNDYHTYTSTNDTNTLLKIYETNRAYRTTYSTFDLVVSYTHVHPDLGLKDQNLLHHVDTHKAREGSIA